MRARPSRCEGALNFGKELACDAVLGGAVGLAAITLGAPAAFATAAGCTVAAVTPFVGAKVVRGVGYLRDGVSSTWHSFGRERLNDMVSMGFGALSGFVYYARGGHDAVRDRVADPVAQAAVPAAIGLTVASLASVAARRHCFFRTATTSATQEPLLDVEHGSAPTPTPTPKGPGQS